MSLARDLVEREISRMLEEVGTVSDEAHEHIVAAVRIVFEDAEKDKNEEAS